MAKRPRARRILIAVTIDYQLQYHEGLPERLVADGWDVHVVTGEGPNADQWRAIDGVEVHAVEMARRPSPMADFKALVDISRVLFRVRPLVTLVGTPKAGLLGGMAARITKVPIRIYELHGLKLEGSRGYRKFILTLLERMAAATATHVVPVSESLAHAVAEHEICPEGKTHVLGRGSPNGVDLGRFQSRSKNRLNGADPAVRLDPAIATIGFVGRLTRDKGLPQFAAALSELRRQNFEVQVLVVGGVEDRTGADGLKSLRDTGHRVVATGHVSDTAPYYSQMDVFCLPSLREGLPTVILEAFASGIPVVARDATGSRDLVIDGMTGSLVADGSGPDLASKLRYALENPGAAAEWVANALELVRTEYARDYVQDKWTEFIRSTAIAGGSNGTSRIRAAQ